MDGILDKARTVWEGEIDFEGQKLAELLSNVLLSATGIIAFLAGYITQDIILTLYLGLAGTALTFLIICPPWPYFNKHPVKWLNSKSQTTGKRYDIVVDGKKIS